MANVGDNWNFSYTGNIQTFTAPIKASYKLEVWGAEGGRNITNSNSIAGKGGYAKGLIELDAGEEVSIFVGGKGNNTPYSADSSPGTHIIGGWNGGGDGTNGGAGGGGATDIRINGTSLSNRILVAGGAGGVGYNSGDRTGGAGGGIKGGDGGGSGTGLGGTQSGGYNLGQGGPFTNTNDCGGGGGGYYGGFGGDNANTAGGGGSGYTDNILSETSMSIGVRSGHGQAIIELVEILNKPPSISLIETNYPDITFTVDDVDGNITDLKITINDLEVKTFSTFDGEINYTIDYNDLTEGINSLKIIVKDDFGSEVIHELNVERLVLNNNTYYLITTLDNKICYLDDVNQTIVETEYIVGNDAFIESKIAEHSFNSIEEINSMIDDLNILKGYKINLFENSPPYKGSLVFETISDIETIVPKQFIDITDVNSFESIEIDNRGIFNVVFSNKAGEWCYFDETKTKVIITELNGEVDLLNSESDVLVNQSNNHTELESLLPKIYAYAKETEQIKLGVILPLDNEIKQIKIISNIEGSYQPLILGQDYTYNIKQSQVDVILSDTYDSNNKIRINLMK